MSYNTAELLETLFGVPATTAPVVVPEEADPAESSAPEWDGDWSAGTIDWPEPCPVCGSLEKWWDAMGRERCQRCEAGTLARGLRLLRPGGGSLDKQSNGLGQFSPRKTGFSNRLLPAVLSAAAKSH